MKGYWLILLIPALTQCSQLSGVGENAGQQATAQVTNAGGNHSGDQELGDDFFNEDLGGDAEVKDPLEPINRAVFNFNDKVYDWVLRPVNKLYQAITPDVVEEGVGNFFANLGQPKAMVHEALQGKPVEAMETLGNFLVNSTVGLGGVIEVKERHSDVEDLGQTLNKWGLPNGFYMVLPVLGPSSLRDTVGKVGDSFLNPTYYVPEDETVRYIIIGTNQVDSATDTLKVYDNIKSSAIDPYLMTRQAYTESRNKAAQN